MDSPFAAFTHVLGASPSNMDTKPYEPGMEHYKFGTDAVGRSVPGLPTVIVPSAVQGDSPAVDPRNMAGKAVVIEPTAECEALVLDQITPEIIREATALTFPNGELLQGTMEERRERMVKVMATAARLAQHRKPDTARQHKPATVASSGPPPTQLLDAALRSAAETTPPNIRVLFEIEHFGTHEAYYHAVITHDEYLVLVYHTTYVGPRYFPQPQSEGVQPRLAVQIGEQPVVYLVQVPGIQFRYEDREFCILAVEKKAALPETQGWKSTA